MSVVGSVAGMEDTQKVGKQAGAHDENARIVTFDLMPREPDYYFVLTEALRDFAGRQRSEAGDYEGADAEARIRWAETAEGALDQIEEALSTPASSADKPTLGRAS